MILSVVIALIAIQLYFTKVKSLSLYIQDLLLAFFSVPLGILLEIFFLKINVIHILPPLWIILLYPLFALQFNHSLKIIKKNKLRSFLFGFVGAPLCYFVGQSVGVLTFQYPLIIGISWGLFLCLLVKIANSIEKAATETLADFNSTTPLKLLYDGECPICNREVCILKAKDIEKKIHFVDISSKAFSTVENNNIDYDRAMSQMHAIDAKGNLLVGIPAFAAVYARCKFLILSTLLRIPFIKRVLDPIYAIFAKNRLWITGRRNTK